MTGFLCMSYQLLHRLHQREQYPSGLKNFTNTLFLCLGFDGKQIGFCKIKGKSSNQDVLDEEFIFD
ncbi:hypothetical protein RchiOBHm_Chr5g0062491 [Rosa chinensis]|uniref:Uncharacterized protein n=1 Tax=Rosa chinensis TaxID=74649 RepID=A0A2P6QI84_ROSCH|nr:hypothetical protein RchiOBHm_Chr5g0062491 [Rosa chinensis]